MHPVSNKFTQTRQLLSWQGWESCSQRLQAGEGVLPPLALLAPQAGCGFWQRPQRAQSCGRSSWPEQQPGNHPSVPRKGQSTDSIYSDRWSVTGCSPAVLEPGTRCKAVTQEWASLRVIPPLEATANQPSCCDTARCRENP